VPSALEIVTFDDRPPPPEESPWVDGHGPGREVAVLDPDPAWGERYRRLAGQIADALGELALAIEHVGSTAVPGLPAKPVIDIDLTLPDPAAERDYVPALAALRFVLAVREPWWYGHRLLRREDPACNLHVFAPGAAETARHLIFRDWLRAHPEDRRRYAQAKRAAAARTRAAGGNTMDYNADKQAIVREIYARAFRALGLA